jgi:glucose-1-phosphate cytidylyltransferase
LGYLGYSIKEYFININRHNNDFKIDIKTGQIQNFSEKTDDWIINLVDTGQETMTGGRLKKVKNLLDNEDFIMTYGDGVSDIDITSLINFHKNNNKLATVTAVKPLGRFGSLSIDKNNEVKNFSEKPKGDIGWINGGFFILNNKCIDFIEDEKTYWEKEPLEKLVSKKSLKAFKFNGFWHAIDTMRDKLYLESLISPDGKFPWLE